MVVRRVRKKNKVRGHRTHGKGNTKNRRGAGCRGGRGMAGSDKHKYSKYYVEFGGKVRLKTKGMPKALNLADLVDMMPALEEKGLIEKKGTAYLIDGDKIGYGKLLGRGDVDMKLEVTGMSVSKNAVGKIEAKGGSVDVPAGLKAGGAEAETEAPEAGGNAEEAPPKAQQAEQAEGEKTKE